MQESARWSDGCRNHFLFAIGFKMCGVSKESARWCFFFAGEKAEIFFLNDFES
jgi:hypothetical protein